MSKYDNELQNKIEFKKPINNSLLESGAHSEIVLGIINILFVLLSNIFDLFVNI